MRDVNAVHDLVWSIRQGSWKAFQEEYNKHVKDFSLEDYRKVKDACWNIEDRRNPARNVVLSCFALAEKDSLRKNSNSVQDEEVVDYIENILERNDAVLFRNICTDILIKGERDQIYMLSLLCYVLENLGENIAVIADRVCEVEKKEKIQSWIKCTKSRTDQTAYEKKIVQILESRLKQKDQNTNYGFQMYEKESEDQASRNDLPSLQDRRPEEKKNARKIDSRKEYIIMLILGMLLIVVMVFSFSQRMKIEVLEQRIFQIEERLEESLDSERQEDIVSNNDKKTPPDQVSGQISSQDPGNVDRQDTEDPKTSDGLADVPAEDTGVIECTLVEIQEGNSYMVYGMPEEGAEKEKEVFAGMQITVVLSESEMADTFSEEEPDSSELNGQGADYNTEPEDSYNSPETSSEESKEDSWVKIRWEEEGKPYEGYIHIKNGSSSPLRMDLGQEKKYKLYEKNGKFIDTIQGLVIPLEYCFAEEKTKIRLKVQQTQDNKQVIGYIYLFSEDIENPPYANEVN